MTAKPRSIRQTDLQRVIKGALAGGLAISRVEIEGARVVIYTGEGEAEASPLEEWRRKNGES